MDKHSILHNSINSGISGASAMSVNVLSLMWMRTIINYQYRNGGNLMTVISTLYKDGGIPRFYKGLFPALIQGPMSRFGDTAANTGVLELVNSNETTKHFPILLKTALASTTAASFRVVLMPVDTVKTVMQVEGKNSMSVLSSKLQKGGISTLWHGSMGACMATFVGHYPWFVTNNLLNETLPTYNKDSDFSSYLLRHATIGFTSSAVSDTCSNSIRILKTYKQSSSELITYTDAIKQITYKEGVYGLMFRGLKTKIISNGIQGIMFNVFGV